MSIRPGSNDCPETFPALLGVDQTCLLLIASSAAADEIRIQGLHIRLTDTQNNTSRLCIQLEKLGDIFTNEKFWISMKSEF
jgi:hypothetical protein